MGIGPKIFYSGHKVHGGTLDDPTIVIVLIAVSAVCQTFSTYKALSMNTMHGFRRNKGWFLISTSFGASLVHRFYVLQQFIEGKFPTTIDNQLFYTLLTFILAIGMFLLYRPIAVHGIESEELKKKLITQRLNSRK